MATPVFRACASFRRRSTTTCPIQRVPATSSRGSDGLFQLAVCQVDYSASPDGTQAPTIVACEPENQWQDLVEVPGAEHYSTSVRFRRSDRNKTFRLYVVHDDVHYAHRDVVVNPNLTTPADGFVHSIGFGNEPIKVRITEGLDCVKLDTQEGEPDNAATCLIAGETAFAFDIGGVEDVVTFNFFEGNDPFFATFEVSECFSLGFDPDGNGNALVDVPLAGCKISLISELDELEVAGQINFNIVDPRWDFGANLLAVFAAARLNVIQVDETGVAVLPPNVDPGWFGAATMAMTMSDFAPLRWIGRGLVRLAALFRTEPLYASFFRGGWDFTRMSDFQVALMPVMDHDAVQHYTGIACGSGLDSCLDLGTFPGNATVPVSVKVSAPGNTVAAIPFDVQDTRLHYFPTNGSTVTCPDPHIAGEACYAAGFRTDLSMTPASTWDHLVVITGSNGAGSVDWTLADGANTLNVSACGVARPGNIEPNPSDTVGDGVWGTLGNCTDRRAAMTAGGALDNGPADGFTPFEPVDTDNEVAIYGLPLTFEAQTCPTITVDGAKGNGEWVDGCAVITPFTVPLKGKKTTNNALLYTYDDGDTLFVALKVHSTDLGRKIFMNLVEQGDGLVPANGDDLLVLEFDGSDFGTFADWHFTTFCLGNSSSSLCGDPDTVVQDGIVQDGLGGLFNADAAATVGGAGAGTVFYEFKRPLGSPNNDDASGPKEDFAATRGPLYGLRITVTQGEGGGKGGFVIPDSKASQAYHLFTIP